MRFSTIAGIFTVMLTLVSGLVFAENVIADSQDNAGYVFVLSATSGSLKGDTLTLNGVPSVIYFNDRPARRAGHLSLEKFVEMLDMVEDSFKYSPATTSTLSVLKKDGTKNVVVKLMSVEQKSGAVVFTVAVLEGESSLGDFTAGTVFLDVIFNGALYKTIDSALAQSSAVKVIP